MSARRSATLHTTLLVALVLLVLTEIPAHRTGYPVLAAGMLVLFGLGHLARVAGLRWLQTSWSSVALAALLFFGLQWARTWSDRDLDVVWVWPFWLMGFVVGRRRPYDAHATILLGIATLFATHGPDDELRIATWAVFVFLSAGVLRLESRVGLEAMDPRRRPRWEARGSSLAQGVLVGLSCVTILLFCLRLGQVVRQGHDWLEHGEPRNAEAAEQTRREVEPRLQTDFHLDVLGSRSLDFLANAPILTVTEASGSSPTRDLYLRMLAFETPHLARWRSGPRAIDELPEHGIVRDPAGQPGGQTRELEISRLGVQDGLIYVPPGILRIRTRARLIGDLERLCFEQPGATGPLTYRVTYESEVPTRGLGSRIARQPRLVRLPRSLRAGIFERLLEETRQRVPGNDWQRIRDAVRGLLHERYRYELREPRGPHDSAMLNFLAGEGHGYCMHFASAAAILLRGRGIPCRVAIGLFGGSIDPDAPSRRIFGAEHAHAWVEIPTRSGRWIVFDPTPPEGRRAGMISRMPNTVEEAPDEAEAPGPTTPSGMDLLLVVAALGLAGFALVRVLARGPRDGLAHEDARAAAPGRRWLDRLVTRLAAAGHPRRPGQTLQSYARELRCRIPTLDDRIDDAISAYQELRFGGHPWTEAREARMRAGLEAAEELEGAQPIALRTRAEA